MTQIDAPSRARLRSRIANVLLWGYTTGPSHPDATFEKFAEQIFAVLESEGVELPREANAERRYHQGEHDVV